MVPPLLFQCSAPPTPSMPPNHLFPCSISKVSFLSYSPIVHKHGNPKATPLLPSSSKTWSPKGSPSLISLFLCLYVDSFYFVSCLGSCFVLSLEKRLLNPWYNYMIDPSKIKNFLMGSWIYLPYIFCYFYLLHSYNFHFIWINLQSFFSVIGFSIYAILIYILKHISMGNNG